MDNEFKLKYWFVNYSGVTKKHEAYKTWARWIITHQSLQKQRDELIPNVNTDSDIQILVELVSKGSKVDHAKKHCHVFREIIDDYLLKKSSRDFCDDMSNKQMATVTKINDEQVLLSGTDFKFRVSLEQLSVMKIHYRSAKNLFHNDVYELYRRYSVLDGVSLQWAIPNRVYRILENYLSCTTELFASPFNAKLPKYYSLFEKDKVFGSLGNFFNEDPSKFARGCYEINPPFIDCLFSKISEKIISYLEYADERGQNLTFVYILPDWSDFDGYDTLTRSVYHRKEITLKRNRHYYYQNGKDVHVKATFNTKIVFMSTVYRICSDTIEDQIIHAFSNY